MIDATDYAHTIIRVTMKNGEMYALDMAGAQYGWHEPVTPWQLYNTTRVRDIRNVVPFGGTRAFCKMRANKMNEQRQWQHNIKQNFAESVDDAVATWQKGNVALIDLLHLPEHEFQQRRSSLLDTVDEFMQRYKAFQESNGGFNVKAGFMHGYIDREITSSAFANYSVKDTLTFFKDGVIPNSGTTARG